MSAPLNVAGQKYQHLTAIRMVGVRRFRSGHSRRLWLFRCDCGGEVEKTLFDVRRADTKSCGCARRGRPANNRLPRGEASFNGLLARYKRSARIRGLAWGIQRGQFRELTLSQCHYCGEPPKVPHLAHRSANGTYIYNGLDRVDNGGGYVNGNVVPCCKTCNQAKHKASGKEFVAWIARVHAHLSAEGRV